MTIPFFHATAARLTIFATVLRSTLVNFFARLALYLGALAALNTYAETTVSRKPCGSFQSLAHPPSA
jgi:hypothetical protein